MNYYNEIDPYAAQWLRNLIDAGHIAPGIVDERSITDVKPADLAGYTQCHFFAGIGVWSHALRQSGWSDSRPVWTGSCPCQPFSAAGNQKGTADERHLWPVWFNLIRECRPPVVFGEQVEAAIRHGWLDLVQADLEGIDYAVAPVGIPAAGVGAAHIRQRLWFVADADSGRHDGRATATGRQAGVSTRLASGSIFDQLADTEHDGCDRPDGVAPVADSNQSNQRVSDRDSAAGGLANAERSKSAKPSGQRYRSGTPDGAGATSGVARCSAFLATRPASPTNSHWRDADWLYCRDGKWRAVEPGTFPLAHGATARVGRLRAYGNAIVPQAAQALIEAYLET